MNRKNPPRSSEALIERIRRLSDEAEWSVDELREVLIDEGIDPEQFIKDIKTRIKELLNASPERQERSDYDSAAPDHRAEGDGHRREDGGASHISIRPERSSERNPFPGAKGIRKARGE